MKSRSSSAKKSPQLNTRQRILKFNAQYGRAFYLIAAILISIACLVLTIVSGYHYNKQIDSLVIRAQSDATPAEMSVHLAQLQRNMEKNKMTKGHTAVVFTKPSNDLSLHYKAIKGYQTRLKTIEKTDINSAAYQTALSDVRSGLSALPAFGQAQCWTRYLWKLLLYFLLTWFFFFVEWIIVAISRDNQDPY